MLTCLFQGLVRLTPAAVALLSPDRNKDEPTDLWASRAYKLPIAPPPGSILSFGSQGPTPTFPRDPQGEFTAELCDVEPDTADSQVHLADSHVGILRYVRSGELQDSSGQTLLEHLCGETRRGYYRVLFEIDGCDDLRVLLNGLALHRWELRTMGGRLMGGRLITEVADLMPQTTSPAA
jgi:hypothetical protein